MHEILETDIERLLAGLAERRDPNRLVLVGRRQLRNMNSWLHNLPNLAKGPERCTLLVNPADAERLALSDGGTAKITARAGSVTAPIVVSDEMMPGAAARGGCPGAAGDSGLAAPGPPLPPGGHLGRRPGQRHAVDR